ncbi:DUF1382 family protein [Pseudomonas putida]|uniref:Uncharacterized protein n=1 Tax=Pseudomonas putida TaxID=303 RepID=A0A1L7NPX0_PSEPU|nr:DUF1382 family protein [Pseudomonas putida]BAW27519.1 Uncharacterized protein KF715C_pC860 [Pseudomonas putida]
MKRAHPYLVQSSMEAAQGMAKAGVEFVPLPILSADDHCELADQMVGRLQRLAQMAETEADRVLRGQDKQATNRDRIEAIAATNVIVHQYLQALRAGAVLDYHEALELMVLALAQKSDSTEAQLLELCKNDTRRLQLVLDPASPAGDKTVETRFKSLGEGVPPGEPRLVVLNVSEVNRD